MDLQKRWKTLSAAKKRKALPILLDLLQSIEDSRLKFFRPNGSQQRWIEQISKEGAFIVTNASGNGVGKTYGLVAVLGSFLWPTLAAPCFGADIFQKFPYPKRARIVSTPKEVESIGAIQTTIKELWPPKQYEAMKKGKPYNSQFTTDTGWVVDVMTYEQHEREFAGPSLGLCFFNEPPPEPIYKECVARTRKGGLILPVFTSLFENPWVVDDLIEGANGEDKRIVYGDIEDNCKEHGVNGTLEHSHIEKILAQYDPDEREARKTGKPLSFSGRIIKNFDRDVHVTKEEIIPEQGSVIYQSVDPAIGKPLAVIWAYIDRTKTVHIYDEWPNFKFEGAKDSNLTVKDYAKIFKEKEIHGPVQTRILDRHFGNQRRTLGGQTLKQEFDEAGIDFSDSYTLAPDVETETGIAKIKAYLRYDKEKEMDTLNRPKLFISPNCTNTIAAMERWARNPKTGRPQEEYKDFADVVRYLVMSSPEIETPEPQVFGQPTKPQYGVGNV